MITPQQLADIMPRANGIQWAAPLSVAMEEFAITTPERAAAFIAQVAHESSQLTRLVENLNYSPHALIATWPRRFYAGTPPPGEERHNALDYARRPEKIANYVYANRMGNRDVESGDGWRYRGRGPIQLTGRVTYLAAQSALRIPLLDDPDIAIEPADGARTAAWLFAEYKKLNGLADRGDLRGITKAINGGYLGLSERGTFYERALRVLA